MMEQELQEDKSILTTDTLRSHIYAALQTYHDPYLDTDLISSNCIKQLIIGGSNVVLIIEFRYLLDPYFQELKQKLYNLLEPLINSLASQVGIKLALEIKVISRVLRHTYKKNLERIPNIKNIIAIASGKGGVGKSTLAVNLAIALKHQGAKVGLLDADLYGPSLAHMLGCSHKVKFSSNKLEPGYMCGVYYISMANFLEDQQPVVWRGPMVSSGLLQLLHHTVWPEIDYLLIDLPPGTGDIQLTLAQKIPVTGALIVTTPQAVAVLDATKALVMLQKLQINILGVVENMSSFICNNCHHEFDLFGSGGGLKLAHKYGLRLLGRIPLDLDVRMQADLGLPPVEAFPEKEVSKIYHKIASCTVAELSKLPLDMNLAQEIEID